MLIRTTGPVGDGLYLLTLGESCHYLAQSGAALMLFDPGLSVHVPALLKRVESLGFSPSKISHIFMTHAHADRVGGVPALRSALKAAGAAPKLVGSHLLHRQIRQAELLGALFDGDAALCKALGRAPTLSREDFAAGLQLDRIVADSDIVHVDGVHVRAISTPGHTAASLAYYLQPGNHLLVDEGFGYYRGRMLAAPGGDEDLRAAQASIKKVQDLELGTLCLTSAGALTGNLVRRHMHTILQNTDDLFAECSKAFAAGLADDEVKRSIYEQFYANSASDPAVEASLERSFEAVWTQVVSACRAACPTPAV